MTIPDDVIETIAMLEREAEIFLAEIDDTVARLRRQYGEAA